MAHVISRTQRSRLSSNGGIKLPRSLVRAVNDGRGATKPKACAGRDFTPLASRPPFSAASRANSDQVTSPAFATCQTPCSLSIKRSSTALTRSGTYVGEIVMSAAAKNDRPFARVSSTEWTKLKQSHGPKKALVRITSALEKCSNTRNSASALLRPYTFNGERLSLST